MRKLALFAVTGGGVAALLGGSASDPASWAMVLAAVALGGTFFGRPKQPIGIEN